MCTLEGFSNAFIRQKYTAVLYNIRAGTAVLLPLRPQPHPRTEMAIKPFNRSCRSNSSSNSPTYGITSCFIAAHNPPTLRSSCPSSAGSITWHSQSLCHYTQFICEIPSSQKESTYTIAEQILDNSSPKFRSAKQ